jgi:O-antigen ligase
MKTIGYIRDFIFILFVIYYGQGALYPTGSIISQLSLFIILFISTVYFVKTFISRNNSVFCKVWTVLLLLNVLGFIFTGSVANLNHFDMFKSILVCSLTFYPFFYFSQKGLLQSKHLVRFFIVILPITMLQYFFNADQLLLERSSGNTDVVNNISYSFVGLIPFTFLFKKKRIYAIVSMMILMFFIIDGAKRGAVIAGIIGFVLFIIFLLKTVEEKKRFRSYLFVFTGLFILGYIAYDLFQNNEFLIRRIQSINEKDGSSGRNIIYSNIFNSWYNSDGYFKLLFGYGFAASLDLSGTGNYAHNDWLELLSNFGLLGVLIYAILFYVVVKVVIYKKYQIDKQLMLLTVVLIWFFTTVVSMSYTALGGYIQTICLAYLIGNRTRSLE